MKNSFDVLLFVLAAITGLVLFFLFTGDVFFESFELVEVKSCDLNGDGVVDMADVKIWLLMDRIDNLDADLNGDGVVNSKDLQYLFSNFGPVSDEEPEEIDDGSESDNGDNDVDTTPPTANIIAPTQNQIFSSGTTNTTLSGTTNELATCRWSDTDQAYSDMLSTNTMNGLGTTSHTSTLTGLQDGMFYIRYVRCVDTSGNVMDSSASVVFSVEEVESPSTGNVTPLYYDNFESGDLSYSENGFSWAGTSRTSIVRDDGCRIYWSNSVGEDCGYEARLWENGPESSGKHSLRFYYPAGDYMSEQRYSLGEPMNELWVSFWWRVPINFQHPGGNNNQKLAAFWMDQYEYKGAGPTVTWQFRGYSDGGSYLSIYYIGTNDTEQYPLGGSSSHSGEKSSSRIITVPDDRGQWMHVVGRLVTATDKSNPNGIIQIWNRWEDESNYTQLYDIRDAYLFPPLGGPEGFQKGYLMGWANGAYAQDTEFLIDDFQIYDKDPFLSGFEYGKEVCDELDSDCNGETGGNETQDDVPGESIVCPGPGDNNFNACYYAGRNFEELVYVTSTLNINYDWGYGSPDSSVPVDEFSARYEGEFPFKQGTYLFSTTVDDGVRIYVGGEKILESWKHQAPTTYTTEKTLTEGIHKIKVEYYEYVRGASINVNWTLKTQEDTTPPTANIMAPTQNQIFSAGTTSTTLSVTTNEPATCRWSATNQAYLDMPNTMSGSGTTSHVSTLTGLQDGISYTRYVRCMDVSGNIMEDSASVVFSVASSSSDGIVTPLYYDSFETGDKSYIGNGFTWSSGGVPVAAEKAKTGIYSLKFRYPGDPDLCKDGWREQRFTFGTDLPEFWIEYWLYVPDNFEHRIPVCEGDSSGTTNNNKFFALWEHDPNNTGNQYQNPEDASTVYEYRRNFSSSDDSSYVYVYYDGKDVGSIKWMKDSLGNNQRYSLFTAEERGKWHRVRIYTKKATAYGSNDGAITLWWNDKVALTSNTLPTYSDFAGIKYGYLLGWSNSGFTEDTTFYVDDFTVYDKNPGW